MKISPPNMWYMKRTRDIGNQGAYWLMNPSKITAAGKLRWRTMMVVEGLDLVVDQVHQVVKLPAREKRVPRQHVDAQRNHDQREQRH